MFPDGRHRAKLHDTENTTPAPRPVEAGTVASTCTACRPALNDKLLSLKFEDLSFVLEEVEESA